jgi:hypothetical protein
MIHKNADDSIHVKCEFDSNVIDESDLQYRKHFAQRLSILFEISIAGNVEKISN